MSDGPLVGKRVRLSELKSRPDLNGTFADVLSFSENTNRYVVNLHNGEQLSLRSANLVPVRQRADDTETWLRYPQGTRVRIRGLKSRSELNGHSGMVISWDAEQGRLGIQVDGVVKPLALLAENVELPPSDWRPAWRTVEGEAAIKQAEEEHIVAEWEKAKAGPFG
jgi:hypothetical protein